MFVIFIELSMLCNLLCERSHLICTLWGNQYFWGLYIELHNFIDVWTLEPLWPNLHSCVRDVWALVGSCLWCFGADVYNALVAKIGEISGEKIGVLRGDLIGIYGGNILEDWVWIKSTKYWPIKQTLKLKHTQIRIFRNSRETLNNPTLFEFLMWLSWNPFCVVCILD